MIDLIALHPRSLHVRCQVFIGCNRLLMFLCFFLIIATASCAPSTGSGAGVADPGTALAALVASTEIASVHPAASMTQPGALEPEVIEFEPELCDTMLLMMVATLLQPLVFVGTCGRRALGRRRRPDDSRKSSVSQAERVYQSFTGQPPEAVAFLVGENDNVVRLVALPVDALPPETHVARTPARRKQLALHGVLFAWMTYAAVLGTPIEDAVASTLVSCLGFIRPVHEVSLLRDRGQIGVARFRFGNYEMHGLAVRPKLLDPGAEFCASRFDHCRLATKALTRLLDRPGSDAFSQECLALCERVQPADHSVVPRELADNMPRYDTAGWLAERPYARPMPRVKAPYQMPKPAQHCPRLRPGVTLKDMMFPSCYRNLTRCAERHLRDIVDVAKGPEQIRHRPPACAFGKKCYLPAFRDCVYDLRDPAGAQPVDFTVPPPTHLNLDFYITEMDGHPDQELLSQIVHGVRFQADLDHQLVILPHLFSLVHAFPSIQKEIRRKSGLGWVKVYATPPFSFMRASSQGGTPRKYEDRWRQCSDASSPHCVMYDTDSELVVPLNVASARPRVADGVSYAIPKEHKPTTRMAMRNLAIQLFCASLTGETVYLFTDDVADYFNQFFLAPEDEWKSVVVSLAQPGDPGYNVNRPSLAYVNERVLGFGTTRSSNYAQRHTNLLLEVLQRRALDNDRRISIALGSAPLNAWRARRLALGEETGFPQDMRCTSLMYTDDGLFICVGEEATINYLREWRGITSEAGLLMAIPKKREIGTCVLWLGVLFFSVLGIAVVPRDKLLRASSLVSQAIAKLLSFSDWRRMCGMLEHIRCVNGQPRLTQFGLYEPHRGDLEPCELVQTSEMAMRCLISWLKALSHTGGATFFVAFRVQWAGVYAKVIAFTSSDAAMDGTATPGLGGYCNGLFWYYPLSDEELSLLVIGVLELLAAILNVIIMWPHLKHHEAIGHSCDALATPMVLSEHRAHSPAMQLALEAAMDNPTYREAAQSGIYAVDHLFGDKNICADYVSRGYREKFFALMRRLRVRPQELEVPQVCHDLVAGVLSAVRERARDGGACMH